MDAALMRLIHEYGGAPPGEPIAGAASRAADFVERAMVVDAARCDEVPSRAKLRSVRRDSRGLP